jgi:hypothetical protein
MFPCLPRPRKRGALHGKDVSEGGRTTTRTKRLTRRGRKVSRGSRPNLPHILFTCIEGLGVTLMPDLITTVQDSSGEKMRRAQVQNTPLRRDPTLLPADDLIMPGARAPLNGKNEIDKAYQTSSRAYRVNVMIQFVSQSFPPSWFHFICPQRTGV